MIFDNDMYVKSEVPLEFLIERFLEVGKLHNSYANDTLFKYQNNKSQMN